VGVFSAYPKTMRVAESELAEEVWPVEVEMT
jgi:hypothetical protein